MPRILRIAQPFHRQRQRLAPNRGALAKEIGQLLLALTRDELPGPIDLRALIPPTRLAWVRRVRARNLWVWFTFDATSVCVETITNVPPVPLDDE